MKMSKQEKIVRLNVIYEQMENLTKYEVDADERIRKITYDVLHYINELENEETPMEDEEDAE